MPRTIASEIGSRTLSIEDAADNWAAGTNALPNGDFGLAMGETPDTSSYAYDRVGDGAAYNFRNGQPRSINFWYRGQESSALFILGCGRQDSTSLTSANMNWHFFTSGNSIYCYVSYSSNFSTLAFSGVANSAGWRMFTITWNPYLGSFGTISSYTNGTLSDTSSMASNVNNLTGVAEFSIGARATISLSSISPTAASVAPMEIAKLAVFDSILTSQDVADLYIAMLSP